MLLHRQLILNAYHGFDTTRLRRFGRRAAFVVIRCVYARAHKPSSLCATPHGPSYGEAQYLTPCIYGHRNQPTYVRHRTESVAAEGNTGNCEVLRES